MDVLLTAALDAADRGWPVFVLGRSKRPLANCPACRNPPADHDPAVCDCLTCHGFYAATQKKFERGERPNTGTFWRIMNEAPFVLMLVALFMAVLKPF